jgi:zinc protease
MAAFLATVTFVLSVSCATPSAAKPSAPFPLAGEGSSFGSSYGKSGLPAFAKANLGSFATFTLSNGLPVILKKNSANKIQHVSLVVRGGSAAVSEARAGYEAVALKTMARGSAQHSYEDIQALLDETSSAIGSASSFDSSTYYLTTLDKYFSKLLPVWADTVTEPSFRPEDFDKVLSEAKMTLQSKEQDPWAKTGLKMNEIFFSGHPYAASPDGTLESLDAMKIGDAKAWYASRVAASELFVVAVGDFDSGALRAQLEATLGKLPASAAALPPAPPPLARPGPGSLAKIEFPASRGMGYLRGDFAAPPPSSPDFMPLNLGMQLLSDLLFNIVRDKHGAVYTPSSYIRAFQANYGSICLFKTKIPGPAKAFIDEAVAVLASGRAVAPDPEKSADGFAPIAEALDAAKAEYVNALYESQATNSAIAASIAQSVITRGDYRDYLLDADRIEAVTPEQVSAALDTWLLKGSIAWAALGSADVLIGAQEVDFEGFASAR